MQIGVIGLGKMGANIARRLMRGGLLSSGSIRSKNRNEYFTRWVLR